MPESIAFKNYKKLDGKNLGFAFSPYWLICGRVFNYIYYRNRSFSKGKGSFKIRKAMQLHRMTLLPIFLEVIL